MRNADIEAAMADLHEYLTNVYGPRPRKSSPGHVGAGSEQFDPVAIGLAAKQRQAAVWKKGGQLSATDAVTQILQEQRKTSQGR